MTTKTKSMLHMFYNRKNYPTHIADHGPWIICSDDKGNCAAIPLEPNEGYLPSHFGNMAYVQHIAQQGRLTLLKTV
jgi:hypothetical protein